MAAPEERWRVRPFEPADAAAWDALVGAAPAGTFLHSWRFLGYHGDRFADRSVLVHDDVGRLIAVLPAAADPGDPACVVSHPGATFGGLVRAASLHGNDCVDALAAVAAYYAGLGYSRLRYKAVPTVFHRRPDEDDVYALHRLGARVVRCDLGTVVPLADPPRYASSRRQRVRGARDAGVAVTPGVAALPEFWPVLEAGLAERHGVRPVHSLAEIEDLARRLPEIELDVARHDGAVVAGCLTFRFDGVTHTQYLMSGPAGRAVSALDLVVDTVVERARGRGDRAVTFGISTEDDGRVLNEGLYSYKRSFGAGGIVSLFLDLDLAAG